MSDATRPSRTGCGVASLAASVVMALSPARIGRSPVRRAVTVVAVAAVAAALLALAPPTAAGHDDLRDVPDDGAHSAAVHALDSRGVFEGTLCGEGMFCPWEPLSRADMAVWLVRVVDGADPAPVTTTRFSDVAGDHPHAAFIERFAELGITEGCVTEPLRYCPDDNVTRAQMASFLVRAFELASAGRAGFTDVTAGGAHSANIVALAAYARKPSRHHSPPAANARRPRRAQRG